MKLGQRVRVSLQHLIEQDLCLLQCQDGCDLGVLVKGLQRDVAIACQRRFRRQLLHGDMLAQRRGHRFRQRADVERLHAIPPTIAETSTMAS